jgi:hypothetical protein
MTIRAAIAHAYLDAKTWATSKVLSDDYYRNKDDLLGRDFHSGSKIFLLPPTLKGSSF